MMKRLFGLGLATGLLFVGLAQASPVSPAAQRILDTLDSLDVEHHWPAGVHVNWQSGDPDGREEHSPGKHTHCSAFVAQAAKRLNVYILRPPEHNQVLLANAQYDWLQGEGAAQGWKEIAGPLAAQAAANQGALVVATYRNHRDEKPGHIAIVRPDAKSDGAIRAEGPQVTQAGGTNYRSTSLRTGFAGHPAAWERGEVRYFVHAVGSD
jgi:hypothetical protein